VNPSVRKIVVDAPGKSAQGAPPRWIGRASWLVAPLFLGAVLGALVLLRLGPESLLRGFLVAVCALPLVWVFVSIFYPASADRRCPSCHEESLVRTRLDDLQGLHCTRCGFADEHASSWKFAEEGEEALEPFVLRDRGRSAPGPHVGSQERGVSR